MNRVARLKRQLAEAEEEAKGLQADYLKTIIYYARTDCLQLASMMYEKLPVEVREMVYEYLCVDADRTIPVGPYYHFRPYDKPYVYPPEAETDWEPEPDMLEKNAVIGSASGAPGNSAPIARRRPVNWGDELQVDPELVERVSRLHVDEDQEEAALGSNYTILSDGRVKEKHTHKPPSDMVLPSSHFLDHRYVGPLVSHEMQKVYYTRNTFSICTVEDALNSFLGRETCCYSWEKGEDGLSPIHSPSVGDVPPFLAAEHIRRLQVRVKFEHFLQELPMRRCFFDQYAYEQRFLRITWNYLDGLVEYLARRPKGKIEIEFVIMSELPKSDGLMLQDELNDAEVERERYYINFLQCIRNMVYRVMYDNEDTVVKVTHYDAKNWAFPRDITGVFGLTKEQWEYVSTRVVDTAIGMGDAFGGGGVEIDANVTFRRKASRTASKTG